MTVSKEPKIILLLVSSLGSDAFYELAVSRLRQAHHPKPK
jgi:hypothetical protein